MFDARKFLEEHFQNVGGLIAHCRALGVEPPSQAQAEKWFSRNSLTGDWLAKLLALIEIEHGEPVSVKPYISAST